MFPPSNTTREMSIRRIVQVVLAAGMSGTIQMLRRWFVSVESLGNVDRLDVLDGELVDVDAGLPAARLVRPDDDVMATTDVVRVDQTGRGSRCS
jgi:hypothetical protein